jgi:hypothetical protein
MPKNIPTASKEDVQELFYRKYEKLQENPLLQK